MNRSYYCEFIKLIGGHVVLGHSFHSKFIPLNFDPLLRTVRTVQNIKVLKN